MNIDFDIFNRPEIPTLVLCTPSFEEICVIDPVKYPEFSIRYTSISEMSFSINDVDYDGNPVPYYSQLTKNKVVSTKDFGKWVVAEVVESSSGGCNTKDVTCYSYEYNLNLKDADLDAGTYKFYDLVSPQDTLLYKLVSKASSWQIGYVSASLMNKYRTFDMPEDSIYGFLTGEASEAYEAIIIFDTSQLTVNAYDVSDVVNETDIVFTWDNLMKNIKITETDDPVVTALNVYGSGDFSVRDVNPLGTPTIYKFDYFKDDIGPTLWEKVSTWQDLVYEQMFSTNPDDYPALLTKKRTLNNSILNLNAEKSEAQAYLDSGKQVQDVQMPYQMTNNSTSAVNSIYSWISGLEDSAVKEIVLSASAYPPLDFSDPPEEISSYVSNITVKDLGIAQALCNIKICERCISIIDTSISSANTQIESIDSQIAAINTSLSLATYFTADELLILDKYNFGDTYSNEYYVTSDEMTYAERQELAVELLKQGISTLDKISQPSYSFSLDAVNFLFLKEYSEFTNQVKLGCIVNAEIKDGEWVSPILLEINFDYNNPSDLSMTWGNQYKLQSTEWTFAELYNQVTKTSGAVSRSFSDLIRPTQSGQLTEMQNFMDSALDAAKNNIIAGDNQSIIIDQHGILGRKAAVDEFGNVVPGQFDPEQIKIVNNQICFTDDNWLSVKSALGKIQLPDGNYTWGLVAESVFGNLLAGSQLTIANEAGNFVVDSAGLSFSTSSDKSKILMNPTDGFSLQVKEGDSYVDKLSLDMDGNIFISGELVAVSSVGGWDNRDSAGLDRVTTSNFARLGGPTYAFSAGIISNNTETPKFSVGYDGTLNATGVTISGNITATSGTFTGKINATSGSFSGNITANNLKLTGGQFNNITCNNITANSGTIGGFSLSSNQIYSSGIFMNSSTAFMSCSRLTCDIVSATEITASVDIQAMGSVIVGNRLYMISPASAGGEANVRLVNQGLRYSLGIITSARRYKKRIQPINKDGLANLIDSVPAVTYESRSGMEKDHSFYGFIAEDMEKYFPWLVDYRVDENGFIDVSSVQYSRVSSVLWADAQNTHKELIDIKSRLKELEAKIL